LRCGHTAWRPPATSSAALGDALAEQLDKVLADHGDEGMSRTEMYHHFGNNKSADDIARALGILASQSRAEKRRVTGEGGRLMDRWYTITHNVNNVNNEPSDSSEADDPAPNTLNTLNTYYVPRADIGTNGVGNGHKPRGRPCLRCGVLLPTRADGDSGLCEHCADVADVRTPAHSNGHLPDVAPANGHIPGVVVTEIPPPPILPCRYCVAEGIAQQWIWEGEGRNRYVCSYCDREARYAIQGGIA
jgi:hypothetical protein